MLINKIDFQSDIVFEYMATSSLEDLFLGVLRQINGLLQETSPRGINKIDLSSKRFL